MGALDFLSNIGTSLGLGSSSPESAPTPVAETPKSSGLGDFVSIPGPKGSKMMLDQSSSEAILKKMQDFIDERNNPTAQFQNRLADAQAWTIGDPAQAAAALKGRQEFNISRAKDIQDMQLQIAQFKAAQEQQKIFNQRQAAELGGSGMPGTAGGASEMPAEMRKALSMARNQEEYTAIYNKYAEAIANANATAAAKAKYDIVDVYDADNNKIQMSAANASKYLAENPGSTAVPAGSAPPAAPATAPAPVASQAAQAPAAPVSGFNANVAKLLPREGGYKASDGNGFPVNFGINQKWHPDVDVKNMTQQQAIDIYKREYWDQIGGDNLPPQTAAVAFDAAVNQSPEYAKQLIQKTGGDPQKMLTQRMQDYIDLTKKDPSKAPLLNGWLNRLKDVRASLEPGQVATQARPTQTQTQNAPLIQTPLVGGKGKGAGEVQQALSQKAGEANIDVAKSGETSEQGKVREGAGTREAALKTTSDPLSLSELRDAADIVATTAKKYPQIYGLTNKGDWKSTVSAIMPKIPFLGGNTENVIAQATLSPEELTARKNADSAMAKLQAYWAKEAFAGSRMEQAFLRLAERAKGVNLDSPAETNLINATMIKNIADFVEEKNNAWTNYKATHDNPKYENFEESSELKNVVDRNTNRLKHQFPNLFNDKSSLKDKFPKKPTVEVGKATIQGHPNE
jgi:hypothetical protein